MDFGMADKDALATGDLDRILKRIHTGIHTIEQILPICKTDITIRLVCTESKDKLLHR